MPSISDPEIIFNDKSGPKLCVIRGIHAEPENATELAVELLAIQHWLTHNDIPLSQIGLVMDQI